MITHDALQLTAFIQELCHHKNINIKRRKIINEMFFYCYDKHYIFQNTHNFENIFHLVTSE